MCSCSAQTVLLFSSSSFSSFSSLSSSSSSSYLGLSFDVQKAKLHETLSKLPRENLCTLHFLVDHLNIVQQREEQNKMNASNLAIVFWPTLMRPSLRDLADPSKHIAWQLALAKIIENPDLLPDREL